MTQFVNSQVAHEELNSKNKSEEENLDAQLADFMASFDFDVEDLGEYAAKKSRFRNAGKGLPGFLYADGKSRFVNNTNKPREESTIILKYGTSEEEVERVTNQFFNNSFEILGISVDANEQDVRKAYKKLSLLIHPDKCKHPRAKEAFDIVNSAHKELQKPEIVEAFRAVHEEAKEKVLSEINSQNRLKTIAREKITPVDDETLRKSINEMCEKLIQEKKENAEYAERCRKANDEWGKKNDELVQQEEKAKQEEKKKWEETRDARVEDWRDFKLDIQAKRFKTSSFKPISHKREERKTSDKKAPSKPKGIDESYKQTWR